MRKEREMQLSARGQVAAFSFLRNGGVEAPLMAVRRDLGGFCDGLVLEQPPVVLMRLIERTGLW